MFLFTAFFEKFKISDEQIGLANGTLAAVGEAVLILSDKKSYPIFSPKVFEDMGFNWNDIYPANSEEIAIYEKQRLFIKGVVHPNGTIFKDIKTNIYYIIENGQKRPILGKYLLESYLKISPVLADSTNLDNPLSCTIKKSKFSFKNKYFCIIPLEKMIQEKGNYYQFTGKFSSKIDINQIKINFDTALNMNNLKGSLSRIKTLILTNYKAK